MIIDAHIHLFPPSVIASVAGRAEMVAELHLQADAAARRIGPDVLGRAMREAGVELALHLPTAKAARVSTVNDNALALSEAAPFIATAGTLHPNCGAISGELTKLCAGGVRALKVCSFSQEFQLDDRPAMAMWAQLQDFNRRGPGRFFVVLDTYYRADRRFGSAPVHTTTPQRLARLAGHFPDICFVGAHMGGLDAPAEVLTRDLAPAPNLYLDTSNAAHILEDDVFVQLLMTHGPEHILFGTDWPWFDPREEIARIDRLTARAGFGRRERGLVFGGNAARLLGL